MDLNLIFLFNVGLGVLILILGLPMMGGSVKPNRIYGFRTHKTLSNETIWYSANKYAGKQMAIWGVVMAVVSLVAYLLILSGDKVYTQGVLFTLWAICLFVPLFLLIVLSLAHLKKY